MKVLHAPKPTLLGSSVPRLGEVKVALGYPSGGSWTGAFMKSKDALREHEVNALLISGKAPLVRNYIPETGLYIGSNRNRIVRKFLKSTDADWLLQIDSDIEFPPTLVETLIERAGRDKKILAASVPLGIPFPSCAWMRTEVPGVWSPLPSEMVTEEPIECDGLATAVILIHREVFEAIAEREGQKWFLHTIIKSGEAERLADQEFISLGEDLAFCDRARDAGYAMWCTRVKGLRHYKQLPLSHDYEVEPEPYQALAVDVRDGAAAIVGGAEPPALVGDASLPHVFAFDDTPKAFEMDLLTTPEAKAEPSRAALMAIESEVG